MKLLKSTLFMIALLMMQSASARTQATGGRTASTAKKAPARTTQRRGRPTQARPAAPVTAPIGEASFQSLMQKIRTMTSGDVINSEGVFTDTFENMIRTSGLAPELMEVLFQAARNLHLPLSGDSKRDISLLAQGIASAPAAGKFAEYYDGWTTELKQDYLENRIQELIRQGKTTALIIPLLQGDLGVKMRLAWKENNVTENILYRIEQLNKQIADTVKAMASGAIVPYKPEPLTPRTGAIVPYQQGGAIVSTQEAIYKAPEFYDEQSTFVKQDYLNKRINQLAGEYKKSNEIIDILSNELKQYMAAVWKYRGIKITPAKLNQLHQQIQQSVNELVQEIDLPMPVLKKKTSQTPEEYEEITLPMPVLKKKTPVVAVPKPLISPHDFITSILISKGENTITLFKENTKNSYIFERSNQLEQLFTKIIEGLRTHYPNLTKNQAVTAITESLQDFFADNDKQLTISVPLRKTLEDQFDIISRKK